MQDLPSVLFKLQGKTSTASLCSNQETFGPLDWSDVGQAGSGRAWAGSGRRVSFSLTGHRGLSEKSIIYNTVLQNPAGEAHAYVRCILICLMDGQKRQRTELEFN